MSLAELKEEPSALVGGVTVFGKEDKGQKRVPFLLFSNASSIFRAFRSSRLSLATRSFISYTR